MSPESSQYSGSMETEWSDTAALGLSANVLA